MSLVSTTNAAAFLGIDAATSGLQEAIDNAEALVAARLGAEQIAEQQYAETRRLQFPMTIIPLRNGPASSLDSITLDGTDYTSSMKLDGTGWAVMWEDFRPPYYSQNALRQTPYGVKAVITYTAGWDANTLPAPIAEYIKALAGLTMSNLLMSGVNDTKLGDMTIKIQRETMQQNLDFYGTMLSQWRRVMA